MSVRRLGGWSLVAVVLGCGGGDGGGQEPDPDVVPPTVSLTQPTPGTVAGAVALAADAADDRQLAGVTFRVDGVALGSEDVTAPFGVTWNSSGTGNGTHQLTARARDASGNTTLSAVVQVLVDNGPFPGPLQVVVSTGGTNPDADGYSLTLDGGPAQGVGATDTVLYPGLSPGQHTLLLGGLASNCASGAASGTTVTVAGPDTTRTIIAVTCAPDAVIFTIGSGTQFGLALADGTALPAIPLPGGIFGDNPRYSPDGLQILFSAQIAFDLQVGRVNADGSGFVALTQLPALAGNPAWSPDGQKIAYSRRDSASSPKVHLYVMNANGTGVVSVSLDSTVTNDDRPAWSPDGTRLSFESTRDGDGEIYLMNTDGTGVVQLTNDSTTDARAAWAPDGSRIAFMSARQGPGLTRIYLMDSTGANVVQLTPDSLTADFPYWSPDGAQLAFAAYGAAAVTEIYVINANGSGLRRIATPPPGSFLRSPSWRPR